MGRSVRIFNIPLGQPTGIWPWSMPDRGGIWAFHGWGRKVQVLPAYTRDLMEAFKGKESDFVRLWLRKNFYIEERCVKWKTQRQYRKLIRDFSKLYNTCWSHKESLNIGRGIWAQFRPRVEWGVKGGRKFERANVQKFKCQEWGKGECCFELIGELFLS